MNPDFSAVRSRVLVVDDIPKNLQVVGTLLRNQGYEIMPATSGADALEGVQVEPPDLILLDLMMPEMDGLEVCRRLKADPLTRSIPVIFLTASNEMDHLVSGFAAGAVDYVTKPFNPPELLARVRTHLELQHARQRLREMNDEKNEFMGIAAHDLRSPLTALKGYLEMILEEPGMERAEIEDLARRMLKSASRMVEMVQQLLNANAIERGEATIDSRPTEVTALLASVVESFAGRSAGKQQSIHLENSAAPVVLQVDPNVLTQILENLVSNAVKYSPAGRTIHVRLRPESAGVRFEVQDEGPGISAAEQKLLFGKFARLSTKPTGGESSTGLGLSIVKKMVETMGGRVWCESTPGQGATFLVQFPVG